MGGFHALVDSLCAPGLLMATILFTIAGVAKLAAQARRNPSDPSNPNSEPAGDFTADFTVDEAGWEEE